MDNKVNLFAIIGQKQVQVEILTERCKELEAQLQSAHATIDAIAAAQTEEEEDVA